jgi:hypothetical protein
MSRFKRIAKWTLVVLSLVFVSIQFVPVDRSNPPVESDVPATIEERAVLRRSCYDCHSNETVWPWYSYVAPVSWLVANDVFEGRENLNFSTWNRMTSEEQIEALHECWEMVDEGEMPLWIYLPTHPDARPSAQDKAVLRAWSQSQGGADSDED